MRVSPIYVSNYQVRQINKSTKVSNQSFRGKHDTAKFLGGLFGTLGTLGAIGGTIIMTGGVALPFVIGYGVACSGCGAALGHIIDKGNPDYKKK